MPPLARVRSVQYLVLGTASAAQLRIFHVSRKWNHQTNLSSPFSNHSSKVQPSGNLVKR